VIDGNNKKAARIAALRIVAGALGGHVPAEPPPQRPDVEQLARSLPGRGG
jgi:hypothetical protein